MLDEQAGDTLENALRAQLAIHRDRQALTCELVDHGEHAERPATVGAVHDEIIGPHMVRPFSSEADAGSVVEPQTAPFGVLVGDLQPLPLPDALNPLGIHMPAFGSQERRDPAIAIAAILTGQPDDIRPQGLSIRPAVRHLALRRAVLTDHATGAAFRHRQLRLHVVNAMPAAGGA